MNRINEQDIHADALIDSIGDGAIIADENGLVRKVNKPALEILNMKNSEVIGKWFPDVFVAEDSKGNRIKLIDRPITRSYITGKPVKDKIYYRNRDGERFAVQVTVSPITEDGSPIGAIEIFRDITKEQELDQMKNDFISTASHQLRTPLTAIKTYAHLLETGISENGTRDEKKFLKVIKSSIERMNETIDLLLNVSRMEAGMTNIEIDKVEVSKIVEALISESMILAAEKNIEVKYNKPPKPYYAKTDAVILTEILSNFVTNAIKYTPQKGKINVSISKKSGRIKISIKDNGIGIPASQKQYIFTKFYRSPGAIETDPTGSGLGLYMSKLMADKIDAKLNFDSKNGQGSTFWVTLKEAS